MGLIFVGPGYRGTLRDRTAPKSGVCRVNDGRSLQGDYRGKIRQTSVSSSLKGRQDEESQSEPRQAQRQDPGALPPEFPRAHDRQKLLPDSFGI